jgi:arylsulfatase A-like enzyme
LSIISSTTACDSTRPVSRVVHRLVDPTYRAAIAADFGAGPTRLHTAIDVPPLYTAPYPRVTIRDESRYVLAAPQHGVVALRPEYVVGGDNTLRLNAVLPGHMAGARRIFVSPEVRRAKKWHQLSSRVLEVEIRSGEERVVFSERLPEGFAGQKVYVTVRGTAVDWGGTTSLKTAALRVPNGSRLDFATGILEPAWDQGAVRFSVAVCEADACETLYTSDVDPSDGESGTWNEVSVDLDAWAGKEVAFRFLSEHLAETSEGNFTLPVWGNPTVYSTDGSTSGPNVVLLSIDTLRADRLTSYGWHNDTAPFMAEAFEKEGTVFDACVASATSTPQAHMSMFTGLQPLEHGLTTGMESLAPWIATVTEHVRAAGFDTGAVTENGWLGVRHGFGRGFDVYRENKSVDMMEPDGQVDVTFAAAKTWLARHADRRFFLFLHTFQVHDPYAPPPAYAGLFPNDAEGAAIDDSSPEYVQASRRYDQEIRYVDDELRSLFDDMERLGIADDTVFIVTSDHGEAFFEHGFLLHSTYMHDEVTRVPLMMRGPGVPAGLRVGLPVGHVDIASTVAGLFGVEPPRESRGIYLNAVFDRGERLLEGRFYFTESWGALVAKPGRRFSKFNGPAFGVRQGARKLARYKTDTGVWRSECYDLTVDPVEHQNLCADGALEPEDLALALDEYATVAEKRRGLLMPTAAPAPANEPVPLDSRQEQKLRALGYLE